MLRNLSRGTACCTNQQQQKNASRLPARPFSKVSCTTLSSSDVHGYEEHCAQETSSTLVPLLQSCTRRSALQDGLLAHHRVVHGALDYDNFVQSLLVQMYGSCGALHDALELLARVGLRSGFTWNFVIRACVQQGRHDLAQQFLQQMLQEGMLPDRVTSTTVFSMCANLRCLRAGKQMHCRITDTGIDLEIVVGTALVHMYGRCGSLKEAKRIFDVLPEPNVVLWTAMVGLYSQHGLSTEALQMFYQMQHEGIMVDKITFVNIVSVFANPSALPTSKFVHTIIVDHGLELDAVLGSAIIHMYGNCQSVADAWKMFDKLVDRNVFVWNAMVSVCGRRGFSTEASQLFEKMQLEAVLPSNITYISMVDAFAITAMPAEGKRMHARLLYSGFESNEALLNALVNLYGNCGRLEEAWKLFDEASSRDLPLWTSMISILAQHGCGREALELFEQFKQAGLRPDEMAWVSVLAACADDGAYVEGMQTHNHVIELGKELDVFVGTTLIGMYGNCGDLQAARKIFYSIPMKDLIAWNAMITVLAQNGQGLEALQLLCQMLHHGRVLPDKFTFISILSAYTSEAVTGEGKQISSCIAEYGFEKDVDIGDALINLYGKAGSLDDAWATFAKMPKRKLFSWNAMITMYALHGLGEQALQLFQEMLQDDTQPTDATFLSILSACSHAGLLDHGCHSFISMVFDFNVMPSADHYNCMIDMLGRVGNLEEAGVLVECMPLQPTVVSYMTILSACKCQIDVTRSGFIVKYVFELNSESAAPYVLLSNIYADVDKEDDVPDVADLIRSAVC